MNDERDFVFSRGSRLGQCLVAGFALIVGACSTNHALRAVANSNPILAALASEDQASRRGTKVMRTDLERIKLVLQELGSGHVVTGEDKVNAALILDHSPMTFRGDQLTAISPNDYLLGHYLAMSAMETGQKGAPFLAAVTLDRYLSMTVGCQKYGTNRFINQETGAEEWAPIDRATFDEERAKYGIQPLAVLLNQYPEQQRKCGD